MIGRTTNRASTSPRKVSRLMSRWMRSLLTRAVNSKSVVSQIARPSPFLRALLMAEVALRESRLGSNASQTTTCVSRRIIAPVVDCG